MTATKCIKCGHDVNVSFLEYRCPSCGYSQPTLPKAFWITLVVVGLTIVLVAFHYTEGIFYNSN